MVSKNNFDLAVVKYNIKLGHYRGLTRVLHISLPYLAVNVWLLS